MHQSRHRGDDLRGNILNDVVDKAKKTLRLCRTKWNFHCGYWLFNIRHKYPRKKSFWEVASCSKSLFVRSQASKKIIYSTLFFRIRNVRRAVSTDQFKISSHWLWKPPNKQFMKKKLCVRLSNVFYKSSRYDRIEAEKKRSKREKFPFSRLMSYLVSKLPFVLIVI